MNIKDEINLLNAELDKIKSQKREIEEKIDSVRSRCTHSQILERYGSGHCPDCGFVTEGWFCPTSPTKECEYYDEKNDVYDEDCCIYCGEPEERK